MLTSQTRNTVYNEAQHNHVFDSFEEFMAFTNDVPDERYAPQSGGLRKRAWVGRDFRGDWGNVLKALHKVWPHGLAVMDLMRQDLADADIPKPSDRRRRLRFSADDGDELDYDRLRSGQDYWRTTRRRRVAGPATVTLVVDCGGNCGRSADDILWRGAAAVVLADMLEEAGYRVELWGVWKAQEVWFDGDGKNHTAMFAVRLKAPEDVVDKSTLANAISAWCFRTAVFRAYCSGHRYVTSYLGRHNTPTTADTQEFTSDENTILIADAWSRSKAIEVIREALQKLA